MISFCDVNYKRLTKSSSCKDIITPLNATTLQTVSLKTYFLKAYPGRSSLQGSKKKKKKQNARSLLFAFWIKSAGIPSNRIISPLKCKCSVAHERFILHFIFYISPRYFMNILSTFKLSHVRLCPMIQNDKN